jgi:hypothetical protein
MQVLVEGRRSHSVIGEGPDFQRRSHYAGVGWGVKLHRAGGKSRNVQLAWFCSKGGPIDAEAGCEVCCPVAEVNRYIERLVDAGFEDRVTFGTDQLMWPGLMAYSVSIIQNADYLTPERKRDILYNWQDF